MPRRIAVVNRGEAACRLLHAVREINAERDLLGEHPPIATIALHTESERHAAFVREADLAYCLGPASGRPYLDLAVLESALVATGADAAWVGWGFVAEDPAFAGLCDRLGVTFIGPSAEAMRKLSDKIGAKLIAEKVGLPVTEWSRGPVRTLAEALEQARRIGYPLMLKAAAGAASGRSAPPTSCAKRTSAPARRPSGRSAAAWCSWNEWSPADGTSRYR